MSQVDHTRERLIEVYRKKAKHYDVTSRLYPAPGYPQRGQRRRAVESLDLRPGDTVVDMACGTGLNFQLLENAIGADGRIVGVDLTDAMLAQARQRIEEPPSSTNEVVMCATLIAAFAIKRASRDATFISTSNRSSIASA